MKSSKNRMISKTTEDAPQAPAPGTVTVRVLGQSVNENARVHHKGETFDTTPERRASLGNLVADA